MALVLSVLLAVEPTSSYGLVPEETPTDAAPRGERFVKPGTFLAEEVAAATEGPWRALCPRPEGLALVTTKVSIRAVRHPLSDDEANQKDGRSIEAEGCRDAIALLRIDGLTDGPVATAAAGRLPIPEDTVASLIVTDPRDASYLQAVQTPKAGPVQIFLSRGERRQRIATIQECCNDTWPAILWAGDLDRDGELDLLLEVSAHYAGSEQALFLSSAARETELVGEVGRFAVSGC